MRKLFVYASFAVCVLAAGSTSAADRTFSGTFRLTQDTHFQYDNITFDPGSVIVTSLSGLTSRRGPDISSDQP